MGNQEEYRDDDKGDLLKDLLLTYTVKLQFLLDMYNVEKCELDRENAENFIQKDFIGI